MSQVISWECFGKCGVVFTDDKYSFGKRWCDECTKRRKREKQREWTSIDDKVLYALKTQRCNMNMLMAYSNAKHPQSVHDSLVLIRRKYKMTRDRGGFYVLGELK